MLNSPKRSTLLNLSQIWRRRSLQLILLVFGAIAAILFTIHPSIAARSHYDITSSAPFNQSAHYPIAQSVSPSLYRPVGTWIGRLILPSIEQTQSSPQDWVWMEILHAPNPALIGTQVRLEWQKTPEVDRYVEAVTRDIKFAPGVPESLKRGNIHPIRLNQRQHVGPLQAIAGSRPKDDVIVTLNQAILTQQNDKPTLQIDTEPVLETGRFYALVKILKSVPTNDKAFIPSDCPGSSPCPSELFLVQHYNPKTKQFDGQQETIRIPQQPRDQIGVFASTSRELEQSPIGEAGWYIYGAQDQSGRFTVQALKPRSLFQLSPQQTLDSRKTAFNYIYTENWKETEQRKNTLQSSLVTLNPTDSDWKEGERALVMHLFGGRGGKSGEPPMFGTVPGHFSYGFAEIVRDPFTQDLQWEVHYQQVYGTNIEGIVPGTHSWTNYMGSLQSGWLGTRPVNDVLVQLDLITQDYDFGGIKLSPFTELMRQLSIIAARYRTGDGTGAAVITPATSCVQDSNQALFLTIRSIRQQVESSPAMQQWWSSNPKHPTIQRFEKLIALGDDLERQLMPLGFVRKDWKQNAAVLVGTQSNWTHTASGGENILAAIASWRTILPRQAQDELSFLFLQYGAKLWFLRTNQIGGFNPDIYPIAPTGIFARWLFPGTEIPIVSILFLRLLSALRLPNLWDWLVALAVLGISSLVTIWILCSQGLINSFKIQFHWLKSLRQLFFPALFEELLFRALLIPYPSPGVTWQMWTGWATLSLGLFMLYRPLMFKRFHQRRLPAFIQPSFLAFTAVLGIACTIAFLLTKSVVTIAFIHWFLLIIYRSNILSRKQQLP